MGRPKKDKDPWAGLDDDFKDTAANLSETEVRARIATVTLNQEALMDAKEKDTDLASKKEAYTVAGAGYKEATKANKLRTKFLRHMLEVKGKNTGDSGMEEKEPAA